MYDIAVLKIFGECKLADAFDISVDLRDMA
jgi:hypothetical protein